MVLRTVIVLAVVVMVNYLGAKFYGRYYLSSQTQVKLSARSLSVVHSITNLVTMKVVGEGYPANNTAHSDFATDVNGNAIPAASSRG